MSLPLRLLQTDLSFRHVKMKHRRAVSFASRPADFSYGRDWTDRIASGVLPPRPNWGPYTVSSGLPLRSYQDRRNAPGVRLLRPNRGPYAASSDFIFVHIGTNATPPACVYSGQIGALTLHQADFIFSHIGTDATPPTCVYSGQIGALMPHQADFIFDHIGTDATPPACVYSGQIGALTPHQADFIFGHDDK
jgi:hypothetical protein